MLVKIKNQITVNITRIKIKLFYLRFIQKKFNLTSTGNKVNSFLFRSIYYRLKINKTQICSAVGEIVTYACVYDDEVII